MASAPREPLGSSPSKIDDEFRPKRTAPGKGFEVRAATLVVGGNTAARFGLQAQVAAQNHDCDGVEDLTIALERLAQRPYDAVIADLDSLPGPEYAQVLRALQAAPGEPAVVAVARMEDAAQVQSAWDAGVSGLLRKPPLDSEVRFVLRSALETRRLTLERKALSRRIQNEVLKQTRELLDTIQRLERVEMGVRRSQEETVYRLSRAAEHRDNETGRHLKRMSQYSAILARRFGLPHDLCETIRTASPMHDVGKIGISDVVLYKNGAHTPEERQIMKQHAVIGYEILHGSHSELLETAATIAWTHHEKYDGSGYPRGLQGRAIPLEGRIVAIADVFDALTSKRVYKPAFSLEQATQMMADGRGSHFDPELLDLFWESLNELLDVKARYSDPEGEETGAESAPPFPAPEFPGGTHPAR
ncbi:MAG: HD-GYP domain-containing protein [SAR324 cluster bacterium]